MQNSRTTRRVRAEEEGCGAGETAGLEAVRCGWLEAAERGWPAGESAQGVATVAT